jgi:hypothetical protein
MNDTTTVLAQAFPAEAVSRSRSVYFLISDAPRVLEFVRSQKWRLLGVEGFHADQSSITPDLSRIADLSAATDGVEAAARILNLWRLDGSLYVHFTLAMEA